MPTVETSDFPALTVEFLSDAGPLATNGTWVDITDFTVSGTVRAGRSYTTDMFDSASCSVVLATTTRLFDPDNSAGTYFGKLLPMRQLRITATKSSTTYSVYRGYINSWGNTVQDNKLWRTTITAQDGFRLLNLTKLWNSPYRAAVVDRAPNVYYRFDDANTVIDDSGNGRNGVWGANHPTLSTSLLTGDPSTAWTNSATAPTTVRGTHTLDLSVAGYSFEFLFSTTATSGTLAQITNNNISALIYLSAGKLRIWESGTSFYVETVDAVNDGTTYHVLWDSNTTTITLNGTANRVAGGPITPGQYIGAGMANGSLILGDTALSADPFYGTLDEFTLYSSTGLTSLFTTATAPWDGDDTGTRVARIADMVGFPTSLRAIDSGSSTMQPFEFTVGMSALDAIRQAADTELGQTYFDGAGNLTHYARASLSTQTRSRVSQAVWGDGSSTSSILFDNDNFSFPRDETLIRNPVTAARNGGASVTVQDSTLISTYGDRAWAAPTAYDQSDTVMSDRAYYLLNRYKDLGSRLESVQFTPRRDPTNLWAQVLGRKIGDRVTVARTPLGTGVQVVKEVIVERIEHSFGIGPDWRTTFGGGVAELNVPLILNNATFGKLDTATLGY